MAPRQRRAVVIGSAGQDGRLLCAALRQDGWRVTGIGRAGPVDVSRRGEVVALIRRLKPDQVYYLAALHRSSEGAAEDGLREFNRSWDTHVTGLVNVLEAVRLGSPRTRVFYAASSLLFGGRGGRANERTPLAPRELYARTKAAGVLACRLYRRLGVFACAGILFNHESPLRKPSFLSQKLVRGAVAIRRGEASEVVVGDLSAAVDWGWAPDTVEAMRRILALPDPDDFIVATGRCRSVADFARAVFSSLGLDWRRHVRAARGVLARRRPPLAGDASKLRRATGWKPSVSFERMTRLLVEAELARVAGKARKSYLSAALAPR